MLALAVTLALVFIQTSNARLHSISTHDSYFMMRNLRISPASDINPERDLSIYEEVNCIIIASSFS